VVDNVGVKYERQEDVDHLIKCAKSKYDLTTDWTGNLHCGICLKWDYKQHTLDISMPSTSKSSYKNTRMHLLRVCNTPHMPQCQNSVAVRPNAPLPPDKSPPLSDKDIKHVQRVIGSILYYAHAVNRTVLMALSTTIASKQATENTMLKTKQILGYLVMHPDATVQFHVSLS
jgi:hypothetical protein